MAKLNPETGLDCVSAGAMRRRPSADADQSAERKDLAGDHTAGPWRVDPRNPWRISDHDGRNTVASTGGDSCLRDFHEANARLIATAPDMLAMLKRIVAANADFVSGLPEDWEVDPMHDCCIEAAALIAKAEGRS